MTRFRISKKNDYKVTILGKDGKFIDSIHDSGFCSVDQIISVAKEKCCHKTITEVVIYCEDDGTCASYNAKGKRL